MSFDWSSARKIEGDNAVQQDDMPTIEGSFDWGSSVRLPKVAVSESTRELIEDQFKQGLVDLGVGVVPDPLMNFVQGQAFDPSIAVGTPEAQVVDERVRASVADNLGLEIKNIQPTNIGEKVIANIARAGADPLSYFGGAGPKIVKPFLAAAESAVTTGTGTFTGELTAEAAKAFGAEEGDIATDAARMTGAILGGFAPAASVVSVGKATGAGIRAGFDIKDKSKDVGKAIDEGETYIASKQVAELINNAIKTDPSLEGKIGHIQAVLKDFPELNVGPWVAMTENPILRENFTYLLRTNPTFRSKIKTEIDEAQSLIKNRQDQLFREGGFEAERKVSEGLQQGYETASEALKNIDKALQAAASPADPSKVRTPEQLGNVVQKLVERKKTAVQKEMSPLYTKLFKDAEVEGVQFSSKSVETLHEFAQDEVKELFGVMPTEYRQIINKWKPKPQRDDDGKVIKDEEGNPVLEYEPASIRQLDSLKKAINQGLRNPNIKGDSRARLDNLKSVLDGEIKAMGDFGRAYKGLDFEYWSRLGIPLNKQGIKEISTKKFADQVAPLLSRPQQAREFLSMVGDMGRPVIAQSVLTNLSKSAYDVKTGELDINIVERFRTDPKNRDVIEMAGLSDTFSDVTKTVRALDEQRASLSTRYIEGSTGYTKELYGRLHESGIDGVINDILKSPAATERHLKFIKELTPDSQEMVLTGLKAEMARKAINSGKGSLQYIKENQRAFDSVFGKGMYDDLKSLADMQDIIGEIKIDQIGLSAKHTKLEDALKKKTGVPLNQLNSLLRDRIMSAPQKMFVFLNKMNSARIDKKEEQRIIEVFTKKGALSKIKKAADALKLDVNKPEALRAFANSINKTISKGAYMGMEAAEEETKRQETMKVLGD
jgi:hypothetical protein